MRRLTGILAVLLVTSFVVTAAPAAAFRPEGGAVFNTPRPWGGYLANFRIVRHVENAIRETRPTKHDKHPVILVSTYLLDRRSSVQALVGACRRGVSVRVLLDHDIQTRPARRLIRVLNSDNVRDRNHDGKPDRKAKRGPCDTKLKKKHKHKHAHHHPHGGGQHHAHSNHHDGGKGGKGSKGDNAGLDAGHGPRRTGESQQRRSDPLTAQEAMRSASRPTRASVTWGTDRSYVKRCAGACRGGGGNMHDKFYAFSHLGKARDVVMVSSSNLNKAGGRAGWNDLYTVKNRPKLFDGFAHLHREMTNDRPAGAKKVEVKDGPFTARFFPMRHASKRNDPTYQDMGRIQCRSALGRTQIYVAMFYWKGKRGNYLASRLLNLARHGCQVSVVYGAPSVQMATRLRAAADRSLIKLWDTRWDHNDDGYNEVRTHEKYMLVRGHVGKDRKAYRVYTGSQNWVAGSLSRSDELTLTIATRSAYRQYVHNWNVVKAHSRRLPYHRWGSPGRFSGPGYSEPL